jgi:hypothetical protein
VTRRVPRWATCVLVAVVTAAVTLWVSSMFVPPDPVQACNVGFVARGELTCLSPRR